MEAAVDTNVLVRGKSPEFDKLYIVQEVFEEIKSDDGKNRLETVNYEIRQPGDEYVDEVNQKSDQINSPTSDADEKLLALALELGITLVTDDKPLQNLALHMDVDFQGFLDEPTEQKFKWEKVCKGCGKELSGSTCPICGSQAQMKQYRCS